MNQKTISNRIPVTDFEAPELDIYARMNEIQLLNRHEPEKECLSRRVRKCASVQ